MSKPETFLPRPITSATPADPTLTPPPRTPTIEETVRTTPINTPNTPQNTQNNPPTNPRIELPQGCLPALAAFFSILLCLAAAFLAYRADRLAADARTHEAAAEKALADTKAAVESGSFIPQPGVKPVPPSPRPNPPPSPGPILAPPDETAFGKAVREYVSQIKGALQRGEKGLRGDPRSIEYKGDLLKVLAENAGAFEKALDTLCEPNVDPTDGKFTNPSVVADELGKAAKALPDLKPPGIPL